MFGRDKRKIRSASGCLAIERACGADFVDEFACDSIRRLHIVDILRGDNGNILALREFDDLLHLFLVPVGFRVMGDFSETSVRKRFFIPPKQFLGALNIAIIYCSRMFARK